MASLVMNAHVAKVYNGYMQDKILNEAGEVVKAGCVVWHEDQVLLVRGFDTNFWEFPKGHAEKGELVEEVAIRETEEETGWRVEIVKRLPDAMYTNPENQEAVRVAMFSARRVVQVGEGDRESAWWPVLEARRLVYPNLMNLLATN